jgi:cytochrome c-type biogenesis protein CcmF
VTYLSDTVDVYTRTYRVNYKKRNEKGEVTEEFNLYPNVLYDKSFAKIAASNPSTKRYLDRDIFTHIASLPQVEMDAEFRREKEASLNYRLLEAPEGGSVAFLDTVEIRDQDTFVVKKYELAVERIIRNVVHPDYRPEPGDFAVGARISVAREDEDTAYVVEPAIVLRGELLYSFPVQINELSAKVRLDDAVFEQVFVPENELEYQEFIFKQGEEVEFNGLKIRFAGFDKEAKHPNYIPEEKDISVSAAMTVQDENGDVYSARPVYFIRGVQPFNLKDEIYQLGLHFRFTGLDPQTESASIMIAQKKATQPIVPFEVATNSLRSDYIVLEAIEFPGINFFWLGSTLMMVGMCLGMANRLRRRKE